MMYLKLLIVIITVAFVIRGYIVYEPHLDLVYNGSHYHLYLWYYKYDWIGNATRTYIKIFSL